MTPLIIVMSLKLRLTLSMMQGVSGAESVYTDKCVLALLCLAVCEGAVALFLADFVGSECLWVASVYSTWLYSITCYS